MNRNQKVQNRKSKKQENNFSINIATSVDENIHNLKQMLGKPEDLVIRELLLGEEHRKAAIVYISGIADKDLVQNNVLKTIQEDNKGFQIKDMNQLKQKLISITDVNAENTLDKVSYAILSGNTALYMDGFETVLIMGTAGGENRSIEEPASEALIRGPRAGFIENIHTNISLIRQDIRDPNLRFETHELGRRSKQKIVVSFIAGIANSELVGEVNRRLKSIDTDYSMDSGQVEQWIEDSFLSPFPQMVATERPDRVSFALTEGKVAVLVEGTPFVLIAPVTISDALHSMEDYNQRWLTGTVLRILRYVSAFLAMFLPSLYIALVSFHPEMLPSQLVFSIAASREGVPFPAVVEAVLMAVTFEILHEAGVRLPKIIGTTIGVVGGLVIGEAAVSAGIVSSIMVIITALTAIASFTTPQYSVAIAFRTIRFVFMLAAALLGLYGIILVYIMINIHLVNLKSFGVPYTTPFSIFPTGWKDMVLRAPLTLLMRRPSYLKTDDQKSANKDDRYDK
ncbi:spore germination protein [Virgibacillus sp. MSP4-1]|uniref:spore germination protein n=1 Tax=Virgibacillus sp. MSP4-1 TaxID=2700081 RepID=UPI0003A0AE79|nr:spore germination protein [Virgibacillus sp. MSP4-1]QHS21793.1 spore germination protein [Virgibacillus sp. MSP4-1]